MYSVQFLQCNVIIVLDEMGRTRSTNAYRILMGMPEGSTPLERPRRRWVNNSKMYLRDVGWVGMDWIDLAQDKYQWRALVNIVMNPFGCHKMLGSS